jgi:hypothetical protein
MAVLKCSAIELDGVAGPEKAIWSNNCRSIFTNRETMTHPASEWQLDRPRQAGSILQDAAIDRCNTGVRRRANFEPSLFPG